MKEKMVRPSIGEMGVVNHHKSDLHGFEGFQLMLSSDAPSINEHCLYRILEYNIIFPTVEKTGRKPCSVREQIIGIAMVSKRDFDNVTCDWSCSSYAL